MVFAIAHGSIMSVLCSRNRTPLLSGESFKNPPLQKGEGKRWGYFSLVKHLPDFGK